MNRADAILQHLCDRLTAAGAFASVTIGAGADSTAIPRAMLRVIDVRRREADDRPGLQGRATVEVQVTCAVGQSGQGPGRLLELLAAVESVVLADVFLAGLCAHLSWGAAAEVGPARIDRSAARPYERATLELTFHWEDA